MGCLEAIILMITFLGLPVIAAISLRVSDIKWEKNMERRKYRNISNFDRGYYDYLKENNYGMYQTVLKYNKNKFNAEKNN